MTVIQVGRRLYEAARFLERELANDDVPAAELRQRARETGIADRQLDRAKAILGVRSEHDGRGRRWLWRLSTDHPRIAVRGSPMVEPSGDEWDDYDPEYVASLDRSDSADDGW